MKTKQTTFFRRFLLKIVILNLIFLFFWLLGKINIFGLKGFFDPITKANVVLIVGLNIGMFINTLLEK